MKGTKVISKVILIAIIMATASLVVSFAEEATYTEFSLLYENSGYKVRIPNFIELRDVGVEYGYGEGELIAVIMKTPEKNSDGKYTLFEVITTDEKAYALDSYPGTFEGGQIGNVCGEFIDNKFTYSMNFNSIKDLEGEALSCGLFVSDEDYNTVFSVELAIVFENNEGNNGIAKEDSPSNWAIAEIEKAKEYNLVTEKVLSNYQQDITREELCELTVKLFEALSGKEAIVPDINKFTDTDNIEILKANALGIVAGISETQFSPNANVTREQIAAMIYRTLQIVDSSLVEGSNNEVKFVDKADISNYALEAVGFMSNNGILGGVGDNRVDPKGNATREQGIALIKRTFEKFKLD